MFVNSTLNLTLLKLQSTLGYTPANSLITIGPTRYTPLGDNYIQVCYGGSNFAGEGGGNLERNWSMTVALFNRLNMDQAATFTIESQQMIRSAKQIARCLHLWLPPSIMAVPFTNGGAYQINPLDEITGSVSGATGTILDVQVDEGDFSTLDASGVLYYQAASGTFDDSESVSVGANLSVAQTNGDAYAGLIVIEPLFITNESTPSISDQETRTLLIRQSYAVKSLSGLADLEI